MPVTAEQKASELMAIARRMDNMTPIFEVVAANIREKIDDSFNAAKSPQGDDWRALSDTTKRLNPRRVGGTPLNDTGRLRGSITTRVTPHTLFFGTNVVYAATQNFGRADNLIFGRYPAPIPARPFLPVSSDGRTLAPDAWWATQIRLIEHWIVTGEVSA